MGRPDTGGGDSSAGTSVSASCQQCGHRTAVSITRWAEAITPYGPHLSIAFKRRAIRALLGRAAEPPRTIIYWLAKLLDLFVIDKIGKMECFSTQFVELMEKLLDADVPVLATIAMKGRGFISEVKQRRSTGVITVDAANRDALVEAIVNRLRAGTSRHHA